MPKPKKDKIALNYKDGKPSYWSPIPNNPRDNKLFKTDKGNTPKDMLYDAKSENDKTLHKEDLNKFISSFRKKYYSGKTKSFKDFMKEIEGLLDILD